MRFFSILSAVLFLLAAAVQTNDPDPQLWIPVYFIPALICLAAVSGRLPWIIPIAVSGLAYVGFAVMALQVFGQQPLFSEQAREMWGLLVTGLWMDGLGVGLLIQSRSSL